MTIDDVVVGPCEVATPTATATATATATPAATPEGPFGDASCSDAVDNDLDGLTDGADPECFEPAEPPTTGTVGDGTVETPPDQGSAGQGAGITFNSPPPGTPVTIDALSTDDPDLAALLAPCLGPGEVLMPLAHSYFVGTDDDFTATITESVEDAFLTPTEVADPTNGGLLILLPDNTCEVIPDCDGSPVAICVESEVIVTASPGKKSFTCPLDTSEPTKGGGKTKKSPLSIIIAPFGLSPQATEEVTVQLNTVDHQTKGGASKAGVDGALVKVYTRDSGPFQTAYGFSPNGTLYPTIFASGIGFVDSDTTDASGDATLTEPGPGNYLVLTQFTDSDSGKTITAGREKTASQFKETAPGSDQYVGPHRTFHLIKVIKKDGTVQLANGNKRQVSGSYLEIIYPDYAVWEDVNGGYVYPFIMTSDSTWSVDVCAEVPKGYDIVGAYDENGDLIADSRCTQAFVTGETMVVAFEVLEVGSPEPKLKLKMKVKHNGKVTALDLDVPGVRKYKERGPKGPFAGDLLGTPLVLALIFPASLGAFLGVNRIRRR
jgi:hypothetical protein